mmetsp:Transcript_23299/g.55252  ORF Transcript_23299/g.55252 Transcript_23299/m.55252 type:complete len:81 (+) Transcript_23299:38-280(+)
MYDLYAVANHEGDHVGNFGHYYAYVRPPGSTDWLEFNDSRVSDRTGPPVTAAAYILFYQRRGPAHPAATSVAAPDPPPQQ